MMFAELPTVGLTAVGIAPGGGKIPPIAPPTPPPPPPPVAGMVISPPRMLPTDRVFPLMMKLAPRLRARVRSTFASVRSSWTCGTFPPPPTVTVFTATFSPRAAASCRIVSRSPSATTYPDRMMLTPASPSGVISTFAVGTVLRINCRSISTSRWTTTRYDSLAPSTSVSSSRLVPADTPIRMSELGSLASANTRTTRSFSLNASAIRFLVFIWNRTCPPMATEMAPVRPAVATGAVAFFSCAPAGPPLRAASPRASRPAPAHVRATFFGCILSPLLLGPLAGRADPGHPGPPARRSPVRYSLSGRRFVVRLAALGLGLIRVRLPLGVEPLPLTGGHLQPDDALGPPPLHDGRLEPREPLLLRDHRRRRHHVLRGRHRWRLDLRFHLDHLVPGHRLEQVLTLGE